MLLMLPPVGIWGQTGLQDQYLPHLQPFQIWNTCKQPWILWILGKYWIQNFIYWNTYLLLYGAYDTIISWNSYPTKNASLFFRDMQYNYLSGPIPPLISWSQKLQYL